MGKSARLRILLVPFTVLTLMALFLLAERAGMQFKSGSNEINFLPASITGAIKKEQEPEALILYDSGSKNEAGAFKDQMMDVLDGMKVGYDVADVGGGTFPDLKKYKTVLITFNNLDVISDNIFDLFKWVDNGGGLMICCAQSPSTVYQVIMQKIGIVESGHGFISVSGMRFVSDFMIGAKDYTYIWEEPWDASLAVTLQKDCNVHIVSFGKSSTPMLWDKSYGKGKIVVHNHSVCDKGSRGIFAASYTLLQDVSSYPVINSSTFFIDDFPSPIPLGDAKFISSYKRSLESFYLNVWWPDILALSQKYNFTFTGAMVETYDDNTEAPFLRNNDTERFIKLGGMLLENGGELCIHGYNHQPLATSTFDYKGQYDYAHWDNMDVMTQSINEVIKFAKPLFPDAKLSVYVPPSNILSNEGREVLGTRLPEIRSIASVYISQGLQYEQEFDVSDDGIINLPRIISGSILDNYMKWAALNELNFHFVNTHFLHPDDVLDEDRGASLGWETMEKNLDDYMSWLYGSAPMIRSMNASDAAAAVQRYYYLSVKRELTENEYKLTLDGFYDTAYLMIRINKGKPGHVDGGTIESLGGGLYLLCAQEKNITIQLEN